MKKLHSKLVAGLAAAVVGLAVMAVAQQRSTQANRLIRLKSDGRVVAELRVLGSAPGEISAQGDFLYQSKSDSSSIARGTNGVVIRIGGPGQHPITITAQEAELVD